VTSIESESSCRRWRKSCK